MIWEVDIDEIGKRIKKYREEREVKQVELATLVGTHPTMVSLWESGKRRLCNFDTIWKISLALDMPIEYLLTDEPTNPSQKFKSLKQLKEKLKQLDEKKKMIPVKSEYEPFEEHSKRYVRPYYKLLALKKYLHEMFPNYSFSITKDANEIILTAPLDKDYVHINLDKDYMINSVSYYSNEEVDED